MSKLTKEENAKLEKWLKSLDKDGQMEIALIIEGFEGMPEDMSKELNLLFRLIAAQRYETTKESPIALMFGSYACGFYKGADIANKFIEESSSR